MEVENRALTKICKHLGAWRLGAFEIFESGLTNEFVCEERDLAREFGGMKDEQRVFRWVRRAVSTKPQDLRRMHAAHKRLKLCALYPIHKFLY